MNVTYELRTPLHAILGMTEALLEGGLTPAQRLHAEAVLRNAERLLATIEEHVDGRLPGTRAGAVPFDPRSLMREALARFAREAGSRDVAVTCLLDDTVPRAVRGDPRALREILPRLLENALRITQTGRIAVEARGVERSASHVTVRVSIADTAAAMAPDDVFSGFSPARTATMARSGGLSLVLAVAKQLVAMIDGDVGLDTGRGRGSTFWFTARFACDAGTVDATPSSRLRWS